MLLKGVVTGFIGFQFDGFFVFDGPALFTSVFWGLFRLLVVVTEQL